jgi:hypothetical protein
MAVPAAATYFGGKAINKSMPNAPDYTAIGREQARLQNEMLDRQTQANRPNQSTPWASSTWGIGPDGRPTQSVSLNGGLGEASNALQGQVAESLRQPLDFSSLPELGTGEEAAKRARDAAYGQAASRLDPQWAEQEERNRTRLANQGLAEGSEAYNKAMDRLAQQRADAYNQANFSSIREGEAAGNMRFGQNMASRQQAMQEMLRRRGQPLAEMQALQGFTAMPGYSQAGMGQAPNLLGAAGMQQNADMQRWQQQMQTYADLFGGLMDIGAKAGQAYMSDERAKVNVERLPTEAAPGVPLAVFRYRPEHNLPGLYAGVVAQDLQQHRPDAVYEGEDGYLYVSGEFAPTKIGD